MADNNDVYVRQDVFDARMDRLEILIEKSGAELKAYIDNSINGLRNELTGEIQTLRSETNASINNAKTEIQNLRNEANAAISELKGEIQGLKAEVKVLEGRVDNVIDVVYWGVGGFGVILAASIFVPMIMVFLKKLFTPSVTIEDVRQVINEDRKRFVEEDIEQIVNVAVSRQLTGLAAGQGGV